jgi:hypothetical protein
MRRTFVGLLVAVPSVLAASAACGGNQEPPQSQVIAYKGPQTKSGDTASVAVDGSAVQSSKIEVSHDPSPAQSAAPEEKQAPEPEDPNLVFHQIPPPAVIAAVKPVAEKVKACFRAGLKRDPACEGEVRLRFVITHEGQVVQSKDNGSSMSDEEVTQCIAEVMKELKFGTQEAPGGAFGIYSIHLHN